MNEQINYCWKEHGVTRIEDITPELLRKMIPHFQDIHTVEIVDTMLKRVQFAMGAGEYTLYVDPKNGDRFVQFYSGQYLKVNKHDRFDELMRQEEEEKAQRKIERERKRAEKAAMPERPRQARSANSGYYQVDRTYTEIDTKKIVAGDILLLTHGNGTQLFVVDQADPARLTLKGRRLNNRGTSRACWEVPGASKNKLSTISRNDHRILGMGRLTMGDPKP